MKYSIFYLKKIKKSNFNYEIGLTAYYWFLIKDKYDVVYIFFKSEIVWVGFEAPNT